MAIVLDEADGQVFWDAMFASSSLKMSVANWLEAFLVVQGFKRPQITSRLDKPVEALGIELVAVDLEQGRLARAAGLRFGRKHHEASLNYADCFAYALSKATGEPLLFKGDDFPKTDIVPALPA